MNLNADNSRDCRHVSSIDIILMSMVSSRFVDETYSLQRLMYIIIHYTVHRPACLIDMTWIIRTLQRAVRIAIAPHKFAQYLNTLWEKRLSVEYSWVVSAADLIATIAARCCTHACVKMFCFLRAEKRFARGVEKIRFKRPPSDKTIVNKKCCWHFNYATVSSYCLHWRNMPVRYVSLKTRSIDEPIR